jgi:hypothetical protein
VDSTQYPDRSLRQKLILAGIPASEHTLELLSTKLPDDLSKQPFQDISPNAMAELILYLLAKNLIVLPRSADKALLDLPWGSHLCQFYDCKEDLLELLVPYFREGLKNHEACLWLVCDLTVEEATTALAADVPSLHKHLAKGQMRIEHYSCFYKNPDGTLKSADTFSNDFAATTAAVRGQGYRGLRAAGCVSWIDSAEAMSTFMAYESTMHRTIQDLPMMVVCTYPAHLAAFRASRELIHNHSHIFVKHGDCVQDKSRDANSVESVFASLANT